MRKTATLQCDNTIEDLVPALIRLQTEGGAPTTAKLTISPQVTMPELVQHLLAANRDEEPPVVILQVTATWEGDKKEQNDRVST